MAAAGDPAQQAALVEVRRAGVMSLPADEFPHVLGAIDVICGDVNPEAGFEFALDLMIAGVEKLLERGVTVRRSPG